MDVGDYFPPTSSPSLTRNYDGLVGQEASAAFKYDGAGSSGGSFETSLEHGGIWTTWQPTHLSGLTARRRCNENPT